MLWKQVDMRLGLLTHDSGLEINKDCPGNVLSSSSLAKEGVEAVIVPPDTSFVAGHLSIRLDAMFQTVQLPTSIADLHAGLANVDADTLSLD